VKREISADKIQWIRHQLAGIVSPLEICEQLFKDQQTPDTSLELLSGSIKKIKNIINEIDVHNPSSPS
jgi:hypothetical protein